MTPDVFFSDTVAVVGTLDERYPLFVYGSPTPMTLLDESTVAFGDNGSSAGRLIVANMRTGQGWEIVSSAGAAGPGEFDGQTPMVFASGGTVHALTVGGAYSEWSAAGALLETRAFDPSTVFGFRSDISGFPVGLLQHRIVTSFRDAVDFETAGTQTLSMGLRIYDLDDGSVVDVREGMPSTTVAVVRHDDGSRSTEEVGEQSSIVVAARHDLITHAVRGAGEVLLRDTQGRLLGSVDLPWPVLDLKIDGSRRIWVHLHASSDLPGASWIVLDEDLNELFRTVQRDLQDAFEDVVLTVNLDRDFDLLTMALIAR